MIKNIRLALISLIFVVLCFFMLEFLGRCYFHAKHNFGYKESFLYESDDALGYKISSKYKGKQGKYYLGMRKDYFDINKGNKFRIVCLGESTTFGQEQFDNSKTWPQILESLLNHPEAKMYEVLNAGVCGYGSSNLAARMKTEILGLKPDMIIIFTGWNLVGSLKSEYSWIPENVYFKKQLLFIKINNFLIANSVIYLKAKGLINNLFSNRCKIFGADKFENVYKDILPVFAQDLKEMISICRQNNVIPVVIKYPTRDYNSKRYIDTINVIQDVSLENGAYLLDCSSFFESLDFDARSTYFSDMAHLTDKGNEKIAYAILCELKKVGLINLYREKK